jgi:hypothetical protein
VAHTGVKVGAPASSGEQRRGGNLGGGRVAGQAGAGRRLDVAEVGTGAWVIELVYTSWVKPGAISGVLTSIGLHPADESKVNLRRSLLDRQKLSYLSSAGSCRWKLLNFRRFILEPVKIIRVDESFCFYCSVGSAV